MASLIPTASRGLLATSGGTTLTVAALTDVYVSSYADGDLGTITGEVTTGAAPAYARKTVAATWDAVTGTLRIAGDSVALDLAGATVGALAFAASDGRIVTLVDFAPIAGTDGMVFDLPDGIAAESDTGTILARINGLDVRVTALEAAPGGGSGPVADPTVWATTGSYYVDRDRCYLGGAASFTVDPGGESDKTFGTLPPGARPASVRGGIPVWLFPSSGLPLAAFLNVFTSGDVGVQPGNYPTPIPAGDYEVRVDGVSFRLADA